MTYAWDDLDELVGGLPRSAHDHAAFWKGDRSGWPGFTTVDVRVGDSVTFARRSVYPATRRETPPVAPEVGVAAGVADLVLIGCVKKKLDHPAPARYLYTSALFGRERDYAERSGVPWFVLSAEHGLVAPETVLAPHDLPLSRTPRAYRRDWGARVIGQLTDAVGPIRGMAVEIHAGAAYTDAIRDLLQADGAMVVEPLQGLTMGQRLAWYNRVAGPVADLRSTDPAPAPDVANLVERLGNDANAQTPAEFLSHGGAGLKAPGLYSWWIDPQGAADLEAGLGQPVAPGLLYAGLAGATRSRSGRRSSNTLWGRIRTMHLGGRHEFSTFRLSLGSILANAREEIEIDEDRLTSWMHEHLRVVAVPVEDADALNGLESQVLRELDPPLNLDKVEKNPLRQRLTELRRPHRRNRPGQGSQH